MPNKMSDSKIVNRILVLINSNDDGGVIIIMTMKMMMVDDVVGRSRSMMVDVA